MNHILKAAWVDALRSTKYVQGRGRLRAVDPQGARHCALGVLLDVAAPLSWDSLGPYTSLANLPIEISGEVGLSHRQQALIASLNDAGKTFAEIADVIERDLDSEPDLELYVTTELRRIRASSSTLPVRLPRTVWFSFDTGAQERYSTSCVMSGNGGVISFQLA